MAATEAAVVLPVLLTLALGAADFGRVFGAAVELSNAVRTGAEMGAVHRPTSLTYASWETRIRNAVNDQLAGSHHIDAGQVSITVALSTDAQGNPQVQVSGDYLFRSIVPWPLIPTQVPLSSRTVMRQYR